MLRPATPLTLLLFVAFVLLLLSVISTPIVKGIPLASFKGVDFGVFGYCRQGSDCPGIQLGYNADSIFHSSEGGDFSLSSSARSSLSSILIVHPIAALLTLICFLLAASAHLHSPSHSPRYLLALLILLLPTLLITLLAFLVDILLFVPHLAWGGWIVLASTILITASGVVTCAMRRTLVSRKARKKRIAQNAEMNGENFYGRQNAIEANSIPPPNTQSIGPMVNRESAADQLPAFTTYDSKSHVILDDDRMPLNTRSPSNRTAPSNGTRVETSEDGSEKYGVMGKGAPGGMRGGQGGAFNGPRDEFGNLLPPSNAFGPIPSGGFRREPSEIRVTHQYSNETMNAHGPRGRGRVGYPGRGYGNGGPPGPGRAPGFNGNGRGIPMGPLPAAADGGIMANGTGNRRPEGAPPGYVNGYLPEVRAFPGQYNGDVASGPGRPNLYARDQQSSAAYSGSPSPGPASGGLGHGRQPPPVSSAGPGGYGTPSPGPPGNPSAYDRRPSPGPRSAPGPYGNIVRESSPQSGADADQAASAPPPLPELQSGGGYVIGQAVEMDAITGSLSQASSPTGLAHIRDSDSDVAGLGGMHQRNQHRDSPLSMTSNYSTQEPYVPPRAAWAAAAARSHTPPQNFARPLSPIRTSPVELPTQQHIGSVQLPMRDLSHSPPPEPDPVSPILPAAGHPSSHTRMKSSEIYYEDVDPRFTDPRPPPQPGAAVPRSLTPGAGTSTRPHNLAPQPSNFHPLRSGHPNPSTSYESLQDGTRSRVSDASNFTSISQRGINPNWAPPLPGPLPGGASGMGIGAVPNRRPTQQQQQQRTDILQTNPDFELARGARR